MQNLYNTEPLNKAGTQWDKYFKAKQHLILSVCSLYSVAVHKYYCISTSFSEYDMQM